MRTARLLFAALVIALGTAACSGDAVGPVYDDCPVMGGGGTCK